MATALSGVEERKGGEVEPNNTKELILPTGYTFAPYDDELILGYLIQSYKICRIVNEEDSGDEEEEPADDLNIDNLSSQ
ncbi:hypothetical protein COLO4_09531 [Corchorus olitorius]|uniref:No apical meristem (NAM) protein n=1 Tax=Corchorus olitorius TaxID=93759 RepID=A0A1R3KBR8_9ROSI|nr:hypothetical protein COLO4_09531 [Corchorus olitorius]